MLHAFLALLSGFAVIAIIVVLATALLARTVPQWVGTEGNPRPGYAFVNLGYSFLAAAAGGYVTAWVSAIANPLIQCWCWPLWCWPWGLSAPCKARQTAHLVRTDVARVDARGRAGRRAGAVETAGNPIETEHRAGNLGRCATQAIAASNFMV
jgi:hypothetical protein